MKQEIKEGKNDKAKSPFLREINKLINLQLVSQRRKTEITNIRNEAEYVITDLADTERILRLYCKKLCAHK